jgi:hypothetical protein
MFSTSLLVVLVSIFIGVFIIRNPLWFGFETGVDLTNQIYTQHLQLDIELDRFKNELKDDYVPYRHHCLRVLSFARYFLLADSESPVDANDMEQVMRTAAVAVAFHDIGLWSDQKLAYLEPSVAQLEEKTAHEGVLDEKQMDMARQIILQHHKLTSYKNESMDDLAVAVVNGVRKADWADFTVGLVRFGLPAAMLEAAYKQLPDEGFHMLLLKDMGPRLSPNSLKGRLEVLKIFKW